MTSISNPTHHMLNNRHSAMYCWWSTWRLLYVPSRHGSITKGEIKSSAHCISIVQLAVNSFTRHIIGNFGDHFTDQTTQPTASHLWRTTVTVVKTISSANPTTLKGKIKNVTTCLGGAVGSVAVRAAWLRWSASLGSSLARSLCQVIVAYALRLNSRAGTEGSTVSSLI